MVNYKPITRLNRWITLQGKGNEFTPCTRIDPEIITAMQDPGYLLRHSQAVSNYNK